MPEKDCLFCKIIAGEINARKVYEDADLFAFEDIRPQAPVHILIVPKAHIPTVADFAPDQADGVGRMVLAANRIAADKGLSAGYRLVFNCREQGGQEVFHVHLHLLGGRPMQWPPG